MDMLMEVLEPLVMSAVRQADLVLINKADVASAQEMERTRQIAAQANPQAKIFAVCARDDLDQNLWSEIWSCLT
jgi:G3E family GTPase